MSVFSLIVKNMLGAAAQAQLAQRL